MRKCYVFFLLSFAIINIYSQENPLLHSGRYGENIIQGTGKIHHIKISDNNGITFEYGNDTEKNGSYIISDEYGINYLVVLWDDKTRGKYLLLAGGGFCFLYNSDDRPFFAGGYLYEEYMTEYPFVITKQISASSSLREENVLYSTENLDERIGICWAEGVRGQGINEKIVIEDILQGAAFISIGFVSYEKPNLYRENSRPKKIGVYSNGELVETIELEDTPNFQKIREFVDLDVELIILEVFEGTKYQDTCINSIIFMTFL